MINNIFEKTGGGKNDEDDIEIINDNDNAVNLDAKEQPKKKGCC